MKIPVFVSCPTVLNHPQEGARALLLKYLNDHNLEARSLGRSDYPSEFPLREVLMIARHCAGGLVLGFEQFQATSGIWKRDAGVGAGERMLSAGETVAVPTPWNHLEAGMLFSLGLPLLIFREKTISGGVFDPGVTDVFIHDMPSASVSSLQKASLKEVFLKWHGKVSTHYYGA